MDQEPVVEYFILITFKVKNNILVDDIRYEISGPFASKEAAEKAMATLVIQQNIIAVKILTF